ncbi:DUF3606 domain-containing protein [Mucilaginibacter sp. S1162]|uniref:DUF3606 domain-containing protein n=1 Tax=Mucilaginibacter humi TaxID=2732510 RepID=A0ABX1W404_9SPHI|nr:DUF3606 domain-containing protein [Mucilaginibacter humi]
MNIHENYEVEYWSKELGISPEKLREVVKEAGTTAEAVREYLKNKSYHHEPENM